MGRQVLSTSTHGGWSIYGSGTSLRDRPRKPVLLQHQAQAPQQEQAAEAPGSPLVFGMARDWN